MAMMLVDGVELPTPSTFEWGMIDVYPEQQQSRRAAEGHHIRPHPAMDHQPDHGDQNDECDDLIQRHARADPPRPSPPLWMPVVSAGGALQRFSC